MYGFEHIITSLDDGFKKRRHTPFKENGYTRSEKMHNSLDISMVEATKKRGLFNDYSFQFDLWKGFRRFR